MKVTKFLKQNIFFIFLLSIIVCVTVGMGIYYLYDTKPKEIEVTPQKPEESDVPQKTKISYMGADFRNETVRVSWELEMGEEIVSSMELYCNENKLADVTSSNYFDMPLGVYQFYGNVPFSLKVYLENGEVLSKDTQLQIPKILNPKQEITVLEDGIEISFHYQYYEKDKIEVPKIYIMNTGFMNWQSEFVSNQQVGKDGIYMNAVAKYRIRSKNINPGMYGFDVRYVFETVSQSFQNRADFEIKEKVVPPTLPDNNEGENGENQVKPEIPNEEEKG